MPLVLSGDTDAMIAFINIVYYYIKFHHVTGTKCENNIQNPTIFNITAVSLQEQLQTLFEIQKSEC